MRDNIRMAAFGDRLSLSSVPATALMASREFVGPFALCEYPVPRLSAPLRGQPFI